ncbi:hypothetical protein ACWDZ8_45555 [Streptomyces sp. NPDC003233]
MDLLRLGDSGAGGVGVLLGLLGVRGGLFGGGCRLPGVGGGVVCRLGRVLGMRGRVVRRVTRLTGIGGGLVRQGFGGGGGTARFPGVPVRAGCGVLCFGGVGTGLVGQGVGLVGRVRGVGGVTAGAAGVNSRNLHS